uniref:ubiquitin carboxyl-terminal hydrolase 17-like protein 6 n=1 Tax=Jaculus jaculus TaxID=51337 RepID=UPI001E1B52C3|nr:ubiquitin carboxyl-terminal hydrolase 17-like protein 6 [Jaculus jaculus]
MDSPENHGEDSSRSSQPDADLLKVTFKATEHALSRQRYLSWKRLYGIAAGLQNLGNTCYLNATRQCLTHTPPLATAMLSQQHSQTCCHRGFCMMCALEAHVTRSLLQSGDVIRPSGPLVSTFHRYKQEDAHEFLMFLLNAMQRCCLEGKSDSDSSAEDATIIREIFGGYWRSQVRCLLCRGASDTCDAYLDISLDIREAQSVRQALEDLVKPEKLHGENAYQCSTCLKKVPATKTLTLKTVSKVLILVMKRFSAFTGDKVNQHVKFPDSLDMGPYMSQPGRGPLVYVLYAVLVHTGLSGHNGHYLCYVKAGNGQWYKMEDTKVTRCDISTVLMQRAYVLFYFLQSDIQDNSVDLHVGTDPGAHGAEEKVVGEQKTQLIRNFSMELPESQDPVEYTATKEMSLDQWKSLQERNRLKPQFNLRRVEVTLPPNVVIIHKAKYRGDLGENQAEKENSLVQAGVRLECDQGSSLVRPHTKKQKKNKQGMRLLVL